MELELLLDAINSTFPVETAMLNDRIGLQIQTEAKTVNGLLITLEVTDEVVEECKKNKFNTILTFHPLIYQKLSTISLCDRVGRLCSKLIKNSINLISIHTTFDAYQYGTSKILADKLGLKTIDFLVPDAKNKNCGMGIIAVTGEEITSTELVQKVYNVCNSPIRFSCTDKLKTINKIAIVGGSGTSFMQNVLDAQCDAFITADATYHQFHSVKDKLLLIDVGHYEMEQFVPQGIADALGNFLASNNIKYETTKILTNPIQYFPDNNYANKQMMQINKV